MLLYVVLPKDRLTAISVPTDKRTNRNGTEVDMLTICPANGALASVLSCRHP